MAAVTASKHQIPIPSRLSSPGTEAFEFGYGRLEGFDSKGLELNCLGFRVLQNIGYIMCWFAGFICFWFRVLFYMDCYITLNPEP